MSYYTLPDEFVRTQMAVGALVLFGVLRVICAAMGAQHGWRMKTVSEPLAQARERIAASGGGAVTSIRRLSSRD